VAQLLGKVLGVKQRVDRTTYAVTGISLMAVKYGVEAALFWVFTSTVFTPLDFINPLISAREAILRPAPPWLGWVLYLWTIPFLWISVSMSIRRAADAGLSPWLGFITLVPIVNLLFMLVLCCLPSQEGEQWKGTTRSRPPRGYAGMEFPRGAWEPAGPPAEQASRPVHAALSVGLSLMVGAVMVWGSIYLLSAYGGSLFLGTPLLMGTSAAYFFNRPASHGLAASAGIGAAAVSLGFVALLLFALEGVICLVMAAPLALPIAALGGVLGKAIADASRRPVHEIAAGLLVLPLWTVTEAWLFRAPERVVLTVVEIDAPPAVVWKNVVEFPKLPRERAWYFRLGIACPERAEISGRGVGAVRRCEFTTGTFVEPITVWEEPRRLAFDVTEQPAPMFELSPYRHVHPPHLDNNLQSSRGEFRLVELDGGRTRLEGRTWYRCEMYPQWYWTAWSDLLIHKIHERVLEHIREVSEGEAQRG
jgi:uncharacterized membrane protein YhaH (DUF805 family)